jgi:hypothetical protein
MDSEKYKATMAKFRSGKIVTVGQQPETEAEPLNKAFAYLNAAKYCAAQFIDSPATMAVLNCLASYTDYTDGTSFAGYETITHYTGYSSSSTIAAALDRLGGVGILNRRRRFDTSNKYTLVLPKMLYLRKPRLTHFQEKVLERINKCIVNAESNPEDALTHNIVLCMKENDNVLWEVLNWYADLWDSGRKDEGTPDTDVKIESWGHWISFMRGIRKEVGT